MPPIGFDDDEMNALTALASSMPPAARDDFVRLVAGKLAAYPPQARGPGLVHRLAAEVQREFVHLAVGVGGKYGRGRR